MILQHGSHPGHRICDVDVSCDERYCSVCRAQSKGARDYWYGCIDCNFTYILCNKCFQVNETLLEVPNVMIRLPTMDYDNADAQVHTRPSMLSHKLGYICPGRLTEVVSTSTVTDPETGEKEVFFRLRTGGWSNARHVVRVAPHADRAMGWLVDFHLVAHHDSIEAAKSKMRVDVLRQLLFDCMNQMDSPEKEDYGFTMAVLLMFPLRCLVSTPVEALAESAPVEEVLRYLHFVLSCVLPVEDPLRSAPRNGTAKLPELQAVMLSEILSGCVQVYFYMIQTWQLETLPDAFLGLVTQSIIMIDQLRTRFTPSDDVDEPLLCMPSVVATDYSLPAERRRRFYVLGTSLGMAGSILNRQICQSPHQSLPFLRLLRTSITRAFPELDPETMQQQGRMLRLFGEAMIALGEADMHCMQRNFLDLDSLEVLARMSALRAPSEATLLTFFRLIRLAAVRCPTNISFIAGAVGNALNSIMTRVKPGLVMVEALQTFFELAYNDPRIGDEEFIVNDETTPLRSAYDQVPHAGCQCSRARCPDVAITQRMNIMKTPNQTYVALCHDCARWHPPSEAERVMEADFGYFRCQCVGCVPAQRHSSVTSKLAAVPMVPRTNAIQLVQRILNCTHESAILGSEDSKEFLPLINQLAMLLLRVPMLRAHVHFLADYLCRNPAQNGLSQVYLAVAAHSYIPEVAELLAKHEGEFVHYNFTAPYTHRDPTKGNMGYSCGTVASERRSDLGLSASPGTKSAFRSTTTSVGRSMLMGSQDPFQGVKLFDAAQGNEE